MKENSCSIGIYSFYKNMRPGMLLKFAQNVVVIFFMSVGDCVVYVLYLDRFGVFSAFSSGPWSGRPAVVYKTVGLVIYAGLWEY